jgi:hypothetical protein
MHALGMSLRVVVGTDLRVRETRHGGDRATKVHQYTALERGVKRTRGCPFAFFSTGVESFPSLYCRGSISRQADSRTVLTMSEGGSYVRN